MISRSPLGVVPTLLAVVVLTGCVSLQPAARVPSAEALLVEGVSSTEFGVETCGAASLSAVLTYWGHEISVEELDEALPKADNGGVLSLDLVLAARERGFGAELFAGDRTHIQQSIEAGEPLILMLSVVDAPGKKKDLYHYVIVDGIDPGGGLVRVHYGDGRPRWVAWDRLSPPWGKSGFATILVRPDDEPGEPVDPIRYAVALEEAGRLEEAEAIYRQRLTARPDSALIWVNLGNVQMARGFEQEAEEAYRTALDLDSDHRDALNNLAWLLLESGRDLTEARELAERAASRDGPDPYLALETLGRIHLALGQCKTASEAFQSALDTAPPRSTARGWVLYGLALSQRDCGDPETAIETLEEILLEDSDPEISEKARSMLQAQQVP